MEKYNLTPKEEEDMVNGAYKVLRDGYLASNHRKKVDIIDRAFRFACEAHKGVRRRSGEPYIMHPIEVARIVSQEIGLGSTSICSALLHDVVEDTEYTVEDIEAQFGKKIAEIVSGLTKISGGIFGDKASAQAENFRKLLLTMSSDIRVVLIKMADRLHNMRTLGSMLPSKQYKIAGETLYIYAPLAHRLGLFAIKTELEDLSFKYEHPDIYKNIRQKILDTEQQRNDLFERFSKPIKEKLDKMGLHYEMKARVKSVYSIWNKMETKRVPFEEVYDLYAARIVFECPNEADEKRICWNIYSEITDLYRLHPDRTRDWISTPKANGYRALHLTVMGPDGNWVEVQIRSQRMDEMAERGFAAHWKYKIGEGEEENELAIWLQTIEDILKNPEPNAIDFLDTIKLNLFASEIVVFTPKGELITLPNGASVLDLAYNLHSELGNHCIAGKVNHKLVPLNQQLRSGDQVEVLTSNTQKPQAEWMDFLKTAKAKSRLRAALRRERQPVIARGQELIAQYLKKNRLPASSTTNQRLLERTGMGSYEDLRYAVGAGTVTLDDDWAETIRMGVIPGEKSILRSILRNTIKVATLGMAGKNTENEASAEKKAEDADGDEASRERPKVNTKEVYTLKYEDGHPNFKIADCCCPIPGDDVLGFVDDNNEVVVHAMACPRALVLKAGYGPRIVQTRWAVSAGKFLAHVRVEGLDRHGILQEIIAVVSTQMDIDLRRLDIEATGEVFHSDMWVRVEDVAIVNDLCSKLLTVDGVERAARIQ